MDEFELIKRFFVQAGEAYGVATGIGDDGAVLQPESGRDLVSVIDTLVAGVHVPADTDPADLGFRAVAVNLSDIAAMGARPLWMTLALTMSKADEEWLTRFAEGLHEAAAAHGVALVGGDTTQGDDVVVTVQITGDVAAGMAIHRTGAKIGDTVFVTGTLGDAAAALELMRTDRQDPYLSRRFFRPSARVAYGRSLGGVATAAIDISDGLFGDLQKLLSASGVGAEIDLQALPLSDALQSAFGADAQRRLALSGGDDYELCFTAPADALPDSGGVRVTAIGRIIAGEAIVCRDAGRVVAYTDSGYRHFE